MNLEKQAGIFSSSRINIESNLLINKNEARYYPELLPVSCGYFYNIVMMLLVKKRKEVLKYLLISCGGIIFDRLVHYTHYHSLSNLLMELMQVSVVYQSSSQNITNKNESDGSKKASDDDEDSKEAISDDE